MILNPFLFPVLWGSRRWKDAGICAPALTQLSLRGPEIKRQLYFLTSVPDVSPVNPEQAQALETKLQLSLYS